MNKIMFRNVQISNVLMRTPYNTFYLNTNYFSTSDNPSSSISESDRMKIPR